MNIEQENAFWLQILGDHLRFIEDSLAPSETTFLEETLRLKEEADRLLDIVRKNSDVDLEEIIQFVSEVRELKTSLLRHHILPGLQVKIHLPPTFINHMLNELDEYMNILTEYQATGEIPSKNVLEHHMLWITDAAGHADAVSTNLDAVEALLRKDLKKMKKAFEALHLKTHEYLKYFEHTGEGDFPGIEKLTNESVVVMSLFIALLEQIHEEKIEKLAEGQLFPLMVDHMLREECYYLKKLGANVQCDPTKPRLR